MRNCNVNFEQLTPPLPIEQAGEVEAFLLKIFEYGDYSFRSALLGEFSDSLDCKFIIGRNDGKIVAVAGYMYPKRNLSPALLGPVAVSENFRNKGIGQTIVKIAVDCLDKNKCSIIYIGVKKNNPAVRLYRKLGFERYNGIVMRRLSDNNFDNNYYRLTDRVDVRISDYGDWPGLHSLAVQPCDMITMDFAGGLFSSKYIPVQRFNSIYPAMHKNIEKNGGVITVLTAGENENIAGFAYLNNGVCGLIENAAVLDFFVHNNFIEYAGQLVGSTLRQSRKSKIICYCVEADHLKRGIIENAGGVIISRIIDHIKLDGKSYNVLCYEFKITLDR